MVCSIINDDINQRHQGKLAKGLGDIIHKLYLNVFLDELQVLFSSKFHILNVSISRTHFHTIIVVKHLFRTYQTSIIFRINYRNMCVVYCLTLCYMYKYSMSHDADKTKNHITPTAVK